MLTRFRWPLLALLLTPPAALFARPGWQSLEVGKGQYKLLTIDGRTDLLRVVEDKLQRLHGETLAPLWTRGLTSKDQPSLPQRQTDQGRDPTATLRYVRHVCRPCPDLNGDGQGDLVLGLDLNPDLAAVSGADGTILWWFRTHDRPLGREDLVDAFAEFVLAEPLLHDVDGDGTPDVLAGFACGPRRFRRDVQPVEHPRQTLVQAVSGKTGRLLWQHELKGVEFDKPTTSWRVRFALTVGRWAGEPVLHVYAKDRFETVDLRTGRPAGKPHGLTLGLHLPLYYDPEGKGELAVLHYADAGPHESKLRAVRAADGHVLWEAAPEGGVGWGAERSEVQPPPGWPAVVGLRAKEPPDLILPFVQEETSRKEGRKWIGLERRSGKTGELLWRQRIAKVDSFPNLAARLRVVAGPDLDGDGTRDLFVVGSLRGDYPREVVSVRALSGSDGKLFWEKQLPGKFDERFEDLPAPLWWAPDGKARPQLVAVREEWSDPNGSGLVIFDPVTAKQRAAVAGLEEVGLADFDGDGSAEVHAYRPVRWNPRSNLDPGQLLLVAPQLETDEDEKGALPAADRPVRLTTVPFPWQARPLPWARASRRPTDVGMFALLPLLCVLWAKGWKKAALLLVVLTPLTGAGLTLYLARQDAALMDPEEFYLWDDWYGAGAMVGTGFSAAAALLLLVAFLARPSAPRPRRPPVPRP
jgi:outer membrane protein assembly factor BamB